MRPPICPRPSLNPTIGEPLDHMHRIGAKTGPQLRRRRVDLHADLEQQRRGKMGLLGYLRNAELRNPITAPVVSPMFVALLLMDLAVTAYPVVCLRRLGIPGVRRRDYLVFNRAHLAYRNLLEKIHCAYRSCANGLIGDAHEIVGCTEPYGCPIERAWRLRQAHPHDGGFVDCADAQAYRGALLTPRADRTRLQNTAPPDFPSR